MSRIDTAVARLARRQHGAFSLAQLRELGATARLARIRCDQGAWRRGARGVFVIAGSPPSFEQQVMVAVLALGPGAVVSHRTAAYLWGISHRPTAPIEVSVAYERRSTRRGIICHRVTDLDLADVQMRHGIPVTGLGRTVLDVGAVDADLARRVMWRAMRQFDLRWEALLRVLIDHSRRGRRGVGVLRRLLDEHYGVSAGDSATEDRAYQILVDSERVPRPERLIPITCADGVEVTVDLGWPEHRALVEIYGVDHLRNESQIQLDLHRANQITLAGYELLIYTGRMLSRPDEFVLAAEEMLRRNGWVAGNAA